MLPGGQTQDCAHVSSHMTSSFCRRQPRLIFGEQLITLVMGVGESLTAMVAQQLRALC
jgi:hypothetical protein